MIAYKKIVSMALALGFVLSLSAVAARADDVMESFAMPSGNVSCEFLPNSEQDAPTVSCEREKPSEDRVVLGASGKADIFKKITDPFCCEADTTLAYGKTWQKGPFTCISSESGLTCSAQSGHGFFISRAKLSAH